MSDQRVVQVTREDVESRVDGLFDGSGVDREHIRRLRAQDGDAAVVSWLEDHNFWDIASEWQTLQWLLGEPDDEEGRL